MRYLRIWISWATPTELIWAWAWAWACRRRPLRAADHQLAQVVAQWRLRHPDPVTVGGPRRDPRPLFSISRQKRTDSKRPNPRVSILAGCSKLTSCAGPIMASAVTKPRTPVFLPQPGVPFFGWAQYLFGTLEAKAGAACYILSVTGRSAMMRSRRSDVRGERASGSAHSRRRLARRSAGDSPSRLTSNSSP